MTGSNNMTSSSGAPTRVSVVMANYNHGHYLSDALTALVEQTRPADEILLVDDGSTDDSWRIIEAFARDHPAIRPMRNDQRQGANAATARAISHVSGDLVYFAAADDRVYPDLFRQAVALLDRHPEAGMCGALADDLSEDGEVIGRIPSPVVIAEPGFIAPSQALDVLKRQGEWFMCNTVVYRRSVLEGLGWFDTSLQSYTDSFLCSVIALGTGVCFIPESLGALRRSSHSYSATTLSDSKKTAEMFAHAKTLITGKYADLFPPDYVRIWERRWRYAVAARTIDAGDARSNELRQLLGGSLTAADAWVFWAASRATDWWRRIATIYLFARLTPEDMLRTIARKIIPG